MSSPSSATGDVDSHEIAPSIVQQAADWLVRVTADDATAADREACQRWRAEHADHEHAWRRLQSLWEGFEPARPTAARAALEAGLDVRPRRKVAVRTLVVAGALLVPLALWMQRPDLGTAPGELRVVQLPDSTQLTLDGASDLDISFSAGERRLHLRRGRLQVEVARDTRRPFVVETEHGTAQALGTRYTVQRTAQATEVAVQESQVRACNRRAQCVELRPGDGARLDDAPLAAVAHADADVASAWTRGQLVVDDRPLAEVLQQLARQQRGGLRFDADELAGLRVSGVFPLHDVERALDVLARTQPIAVERGGWRGGIDVRRADTGTAPDR